MHKMKVNKLVLAALMAALSYIGFAVFKIDINVGAYKTAFHLGNTFVVLGALLLGGVIGGLAGAIGLTIADLTSGYAMYAPTTFILKMCIGLICGLVAHKLMKINQKQGKELVFSVFISALSGMLFNIIFDPLVSFFRAYILLNLGVTTFAGKSLKVPDLATIIAKMSAITTFVNAIITILIVTMVYSSIAKILKK